MASSERVKRPFWAHQLAEYIVGLVLIAAGLQNPSPTFPVLAGGLIVVNAAIVTGPLGAWKAVDRPMHRWLDVGVVGIIAVAAALPFLPIDNASRLMMLGAAVVIGVMWVTSDFESAAAKKARRPGGRKATPAERSESVGRFAGRLVNQGRAAIKKRDS